MANYRATKRRKHKKKTVSKFDILVFMSVCFILCLSIMQFSGVDIRANAQNIAQFAMSNKGKAEDVVMAIGKTVAHVSEEAVVTVFSIFEEDEELDLSKSNDAGFEKSEPVFLAESAVPDELIYPQMLDFSSEDIDDTENVEFEIPSPDVVNDDEFNLPFEYITPTQGRLTSPFGYRTHPISGEMSFHYGVDIANNTGTNILAFANGSVEYIGFDNINGNYIILEHGDGYKSLYAHCDKITVSVNDEIEIGDKIALMGSTGYSTGSHLHFEVRKDGKILDPAPYIEL